MEWSFGKQRVSPAVGVMGKGRLLLFLRNVELMLWQPHREMECVKLWLA
jgi:hypothetical protein